MYSGATIFDWPRPYYLPTVGDWTWTPEPDAIAMGWFGLLGYASTGWLLGWALGGLPPLRSWIETRFPAVARAVLVVVALSLAAILARELLHLRRHSDRQELRPRSGWDRWEQEKGAGFPRRTLDARHQVATLRRRNDAVRDLNAHPAFRSRRAIR